MSRVMELVTEDSADLVAKRAYTAFRKIGKVHEYKPQSHVEGKVYIDGWPALLTVEWRPHRDGVRVRLDISATSADTLSRAADEAMYKFAEMFKRIQPDQCIEPGRIDRRIVGWSIAAVTAVGLAAAYYLGLIPH